LSKESKYGLRFLNPIQLQANVNQMPENKHRRGFRLLVLALEDTVKIVEFNALFGVRVEG
jgi:hypothetical protein